ncbi:unnamed protein product [Brugia pahangi]|uniref:BTB_2 domain-containing protein n=1 Tax=Brugia pahangi TaxID=6280 RepID=A0A0N4SY05_BRUPA|nr:unnamed protein product [Brugia pahangi]
MALYQLFVSSLQQLHTNSFIEQINFSREPAMARNRHTDDILNVNVGGKRYTVRRTDLLADPKSKLAEWFKPGTVKQIATDKGGNYYLDRDPKSFRHILAYLRLKKEKFVLSLALPAKPDDLAKLVAECEALNMVELKNLALDVLQKYQRTEEQHYVTSYVQIALRDYETWQFDREQVVLLISEITNPELVEQNLNQTHHLMIVALTAILQQDDESYMKLQGTIIKKGKGGSAEMASAVTSAYDEWDNM